MIKWKINTNELFYIEGHYLNRTFLWNIERLLSYNHEDNQIKVSYFMQSHSFYAYSAYGLFSNHQH